LGTIGEHIVVSTGYVLPVPAGNKKFFVKSDMKNNVFNINLFPGFTSKNELMEKLFYDDAVDGVVMRTYGAGNAPDDPAFLATVRKSIAKGKLIVNVSQCQVGTVEMGLYEASSELLEAGVLSGLYMTPEAALTKLMWTLGTQFGEGRTNQVQISQRGEQTENLFDLRLGGLTPEKAASVYTNAVSPDGRLDRDRISRAMLRISGLGVVDAHDGDVVLVSVFMNKPNSDHATPTDSEERCVAIIEFAYDAAKPEQTRMKNITYKTQNVIGKGDVILTLVARKTGKPGIAEPAKIFFKGLYIAVYATA
jgi:L-asparaginase